MVKSKPFANTNWRPSVFLTNDTTNGRKCKRRRFKHPNARIKARRVRRPVQRQRMNNAYSSKGYVENYDIELYKPISKKSYVVKVDHVGRFPYMFGKEWRLFVAREKLMKDNLLEFLFYPSPKKSIIVVITRVGVPTSFIEGFKRKTKIRLPTHFMKERESIRLEKEESESTYDPVEDGIHTDDDGDENVDQAEVSKQEDSTLPEMEWTTTLSKSNVLGKNPYLVTDYAWAGRISSTNMN
ncbi:hypothetical protein ZOSMA_33G00810 [Zostera marina]|uniref:Uncharacterized protein n=1 Tax=Zostera marina TaxID=29655 RepID=A0A0K9PA38_ZOSMR|nr:hypothetical protein ZOSMA_33G00810 [Zostera marina]